MPATQLDQHNPGGYQRQPAQPRRVQIQPMRLHLALPKNSAAQAKGNDSIRVETAAIIWLVRPDAL